MLKNSSIRTVRQIITRRVRRSDTDSVYYLKGDIKDDRTLIIKTITCSNSHCSYGNCATNCRGNLLFLQNIMPTNKYVLRIENDHSEFAFLRNFSSYTSSKERAFNLTCIFPNSLFDDIDKFKDPFGQSLSKTSLVGIVFLCACVILVFTLSMGWFATIYYRRFMQYRIEKNNRKELAKTTQEMLDKSPIITYDSNNADIEFNDKEPTCAICLEIFKNKEQLRKLICSHYFHLTCIDPWLLSHQSCPLCNRNILSNSIPSISSSITIAENEQISNGIPSTVNNDNNRTIQL